MKEPRWIAAALLIAGLALTSRAAYLRAKAELASVLIHHAWNEEIRSGKAQVPWPWADTHPVARLRIPRLGYDEIVLEGASARALAFGPAHMQSGAPFGRRGNLLLAGHRDSWFRKLERIAPGDLVSIEFQDASGKRTIERTYTVAVIQISDPENVPLLAPTADDALTLITCYPFSRSPYSPKRFAVRAIPIPGQS